MAPHPPTLVTPRQKPGRSSITRQDTWLAGGRADQLSRARIAATNASRSSRRCSTISMTILTSTTSYPWTRMFQKPTICRIVAVRAGATHPPRSRRSNSSRLVRGSPRRVRDDVRGHVEPGLDRDLQRMLDEPLLPHIGGDGGGPRELAELLDARLDEG